MALFYIPILWELMCMVLHSCHTIQLWPKVDYFLYVIVTWLSISVFPVSLFIYFLQQFHPWWLFSMFACCFSQSSNHNIFAIHILNACHPFVLANLPNVCFYHVFWVVIHVMLFYIFSVFLFLSPFFGF